MSKKFEIRQPKKFEIDPESPLEKDVKAGLNQIRNLGPHKPMGYLPIDSLRDYFRSSAEKEIEIAKQKGYKYLLAEHAPVGLKGALYVYEEESLQRLLDSNKEILLRHGWPITGDKFVYEVSLGWVLDYPELMSVIQKAFGDYRG